MYLKKLQELADDDIFILLKEGDKYLQGETPFQFKFVNINPELLDYKVTIESIQMLDLNGYKGYHLTPVYTLLLEED